MECQTVVILNTVVLDLRPAMPQKLSRRPTTSRKFILSALRNFFINLFINYGNFDCNVITVVVRLQRQKYSRMMYNAYMLQCGDIQFNTHLDKISHNISRIYSSCCRNFGSLLVTGFWTVTKIITCKLAHWNLQSQGSNHCMYLFPQP